MPDIFEPLTHPRRLQIDNPQTVEELRAAYRNLKHDIRRLETLLEQMSYRLAKAYTGDYAE